MSSNKSNDISPSDYHHLRIFVPAIEAIENVQVVELPIVDSLHPRPPYMPLAIPKDLSPRIMRLHGNPIVWWVGQFLKYALKPQAALRNDMQETQKRLGFKSPIVG